MGIVVPQVERRALTPERAGRRRVEKGLVAFSAPNPLFDAVGVTRALPPRGLTVAEKELRFLDGREEESRVGSQGFVQRGRAGFGSSDDQEIGQGHVDSL